MEPKPLPIPVSQYKVYVGLNPTTMVTTPPYSYDFALTPGKKNALPTIQFHDLDSHVAIIRRNTPERIASNFINMAVQKCNYNHILPDPDFTNYLYACYYAAACMQLSQTLKNIYHPWMTSLKKLLPIVTSSSLPDIQIIGDFSTQQGRVTISKDHLFDWLIRSLNYMSQYDNIAAQLVPIHQPQNHIVLNWQLNPVTMREIISVIKRLLLQFIERNAILAIIINAVPTNIKMTADEIHQSLGGQLNNAIALQPNPMQAIWAQILLAINLLYAQGFADFDIPQLTNAWTQQLATISGIALYAENQRPKDAIESLALRMNYFNQTHKPRLTTIKFEFFQPSTEGTRAQFVQSDGSHSSSSAVNVTDKDFEDGHIYNINLGMDYVQMQASLSNSSFVRPFYTKLLN